MSRDTEPIEKGLPSVRELEHYTSALRIAKKRADQDMPRLREIAAKQAALEQLEGVICEAVGLCRNCRALFLLLGNVEAQLRRAEGRV